MFSTQGPLTTMYITKCSFGLFVLNYIEFVVITSKPVKEARMLFQERLSTGVWRRGVTSRGIKWERTRWEPERSLISNLALKSMRAEPKSH